MTQYPSRRRLLFLVPFPPRLDAMDGGGRAAAQFLTRLAVRHQVALLYLRRASDPPVDEMLRENCDLVEEVIRPEISFGFGQRWSRLNSVLRGTPIWATGLAVAAYGERVGTISRKWRPDIVQIEYHVMGQYLTALAGCSAPRVLTQHEPGAAAAEDLWKSNQGFARWARYLDMLAWKKFERAIMKRIQAVVVFTERDRQAVARLNQQTPIVRIPLGTVISDRPLNPLGYQPLSLVFVGNFIHPPNVDAALRLVQAIFPAVQKRHPELRLYIVGDQPPPEVKQMAGPKVTVTGRVADVSPYLERAAVVVAPLRLGGGMRVKVLEALAAGKAVVASPLAAEGLEVLDGEQIALAETDEDFAKRIIHLLDDADQRALLAARARAWACANLGWDEPIAAYERLYHTLLMRSET
jgi:polysaccharide biosynthesis protein PslH